MTKRHTLHEAIVKMDNIDVVGVRRAISSPEQTNVTLFH